MGVNASRSSGSSDTGVIGRALTMPSHFAINVPNCSPSNTCSDVNPAKTFLTVRICLSHTPPMWEAYGGLKIHSTLCSWSFLSIRA